MDCSPPGSSVHGILQARVLEWGAIAFSITKQGLCKLMLISDLFQVNVSSRNEEGDDQPAQNQYISEAHSFIFPFTYMQYLLNIY